MTTGPQYRVCLRNRKLRQQEIISTLIQAKDAYVVLGEILLPHEEIRAQRMATPPKPNSVPLRYPLCLSFISENPVALGRIGHVQYSLLGGTQNLVCLCSS